MYGSVADIERHALLFFEKDIRVKITAIMVLLVLVSMLASLVVSHVVISSVIRDTVEDAMLDEAHMVDSLLRVALERRDSRMKLLSSYPVMRDPSASVASKAAALELFMVAWPIGKGGLLLDTGGNPVCGTGSLGAIGNCGETPWFKNAQAAAIEFTYVHEKKDLERIGYSSPVLAVSSPLRDPGEQIFSYVVAFTTLSDIIKAIDSAKIEETGHGFLIDESGGLVAGSVFAGKRHPSDKSAAREAEKLSLQMSKLRSGKASVSFEGQSYLVAYTPVEPIGARFPEMQWTAGVVVPAREAFAPVSLVTLAILGLTLIIIVFAFVAAVLLGRSISRPIEELAASAEKMGSGDLTGEIVIRTRDQVGTLAAAFLRMRDYLRSALGEAAYSSEGMSLLAEEQSAATREVFSNTEEIVDSVVVLARNMEAQAQKIRRIMDMAGQMPEGVVSSPVYAEVSRLLEESEILAEVGSNKAVEIASATQEQRAAARDVAAAARRLSVMASELKDMVKGFKT